MPDTPWRDDNETTSPATRSCPICERAFTPIRRQLFCSDRCRKTAWRRRTTTPAAALAVPPPHRTRQSTVYACPDCETRYLAEQWCPDCARPCRRVGPGGLCPHCEEPITVTDLLDTQVPGGDAMPR
jgi:predicted nucleic acid-binding Zn ribbon protein